MEIQPSLHKLSVIIPARNEAHCIDSTVRHLYVELSIHQIPHEIVVVDDGSSDKTNIILDRIRNSVPTLNLLKNNGLHGFAPAIIYGLDRMTGDAAVIMMADESDDSRDVVKYWIELNKGVDCVFGSRFIKGGVLVDYPWPKYILNRLGNKLIQILFGIKLNDITNAFKAYRKDVLDNCRPFVSRQFNLTVELPLKAILKGYQWTVIPISWKNRKGGLAKFKIHEMGSRYFFIILYVWLEYFLCRADFKLKEKSI